MAALLSEADQCGVVTELSGRKLREMTGLDSPSIKHQLNRLLSLGFLRSYVPGVSHGVLVGSKTMSIYYLNLDHPQLQAGQRKQQLGLVVYATQVHLKHDLIEAALPATKLKDRAVQEMLYHRLASHTSHLLTALWSDPECAIPISRREVSKALLVSQARHCQSALNPTSLTDGVTLRKGCMLRRVGGPKVSIRGCATGTFGQNTGRRWLGSYLHQKQVISGARCR